MTGATTPDRPFATTLAPARSTRDRWLVLLVDDESEIHDVTRLVLGNTSFLGIPVELRSAYSAAEARAFLEAHPETALMLLDVVMETDDAGLRLVNFVRERLGNTDVQIVLRTGQPGMAPEREVIPAYDINGYFLKTEMVAQKLQSIVISSLRAFSYITTLKPEGPEAASAPAEVSRNMRRMELEADLAKTLRNDELYLLAQPQVHLGTGAIAAVELIPTWKRGEAVLGPIQLADEVRDPDLRLELDAWLIRKGCAWLASWRNLRAPPICVSLPAFTESIWDSDLLSILDRSLSSTKAPRGSLDLILPEATLQGSATQAREAVALIQSMGISVTLVNFGIGPMSLPHLHRLLPDRAKIHHSFVRNAAQDRERSSIARSIIALAHTLGLTVIADGIVMEEDLQFFKWEGCDIGQGDLLAGPMAVADVASAIRSGATPAHWKGDLH